MSTSARVMIDNEIFQALFTKATEGIIIADKEGIIQSANPSASALFGYASMELEGNPVEVLIPDHLRSGHHGHRERYNQNATARPMGKGIVLTGRRKDGTLFPVEISLSPFVHQERNYVIAFIIDITEKVISEEKLRNHSKDLEKQVHDRTLVLQDAINELERTKQDLKDALEQEKELNDMKSRFVSMASHEFRTPLATILSSLSLVSKYYERNETEKVEKHIARIKSSVSNMTDILNDFLSLGKLEEGKITGEPLFFNLRVMIDEIIPEMQNISKPGQHIEYNYRGSGMVYLDKKIIRNILLNLISNAIKFSGEGKPIFVQVDQQQNQVHLSIADEGIGIPREDLDHLFERFHRGKNATNIQGTGLGLNIVKKYVELMKGEVQVESVLEKGTKISILLPQPDQILKA